MTYESENLFAIKKGNKEAMVRKSEFIKGYTVSFYYDGEPDFEYKRGSGGNSVEVCKTMEQAKRKAKYYVNK